MISESTQTDKESAMSTTSERVNGSVDSDNSQNTYPLEASIRSHINIWATNIQNVLRREKLLFRFLLFVFLVSFFKSLYVICAYKSPENPITGLAYFISSSVMGEVSIVVFSFTVVMVVFYSMRFKKRLLREMEAVLEEKPAIVSAGGAA